MVQHSSCDCSCLTWRRESRPAVCDGDGPWPASAQSSLCWRLFPDLYGLQKGWTESDPFTTRRLQCMFICIQTGLHVNILSSGLIGHASLPSNVSPMSDGGRQPPRITLMCTQGWGLRPWNYTIQIIQSASLSIVAQIKQISFGGNNNEVVLQIRIIRGEGGVDQANQRGDEVMKTWSDLLPVPRCAPVLMFGAVMDSSVVFGLGRGRFFCV